jgi:hypothetical protein
MASGSVHQTYRQRIIKNFGIAIKNLMHRPQDRGPNHRGTGQPVRHWRISSPVKIEHYCDINSIDPRG